MSFFRRMTSMLLSARASVNSFSLVTGAYSQPVRVMFSVTGVEESHSVPSLYQPEKVWLGLSGSGMLVVLPDGTTWVA